MTEEYRILRLLRRHMLSTSEEQKDGGGAEVTSCRCHGAYVWAMQCYQDRISLFIFSLKTEFIFRVVSGFVAKWNQ